MTTRTRVLIPDTSVLHNADKTRLVSSELEEFLTSEREFAEIQLVLPEVVRGELVQQATRAAWTTLERAEQGMARVSEIAGAKYAIKTDKATVRSDIEARFDSWLSGLAGAVEATPAKDIDWDAVIQAAIWRRPPFGADDNSSAEKGFRDAMILETAVAYCARHNGSQDIAFVAADGLLLSTARDRLAGLESCTTHDSLDAFASYLRLIRDGRPKTRESQIPKLASALFYDGEAKTGLFFDWYLDRRIRDENPKEFEPPTVEAESLMDVLIGKSSPRSWTDAASEEVHIGSSRYQGTDEEGRYQWKNAVTFRQPFIFIGSGAASREYCKEDYRLRLIKFDVNWTSEVSEGGEPSDAKPGPIELVGSSFEPLDGLLYWTEWGEDRTT